MKFSLASITASISLLSLLLISTPAHPQEARPATAAPVSLGLQEIPEAKIDEYVGKSNAVVELLNTSLRASESWRRYLSWVDVKRGPTGKERIIYGLYSVSDSSAKDAIEKARLGAGGEPAIPALDGATKELATAFEALFPIMNEAEAYYERKDYLYDKMKGGRELHEKLVPAALAYLAVREKTESLQEQFKDMLDRQQLARIEKTEGKSVHWHARYTSMLAKKAVDLLPRDPRKAGDMKAFDEALASFGDAVKDLDTAVRTSGKSSSFDSSPRDLLGKLREMRAELGKGRVNSMSYGMDFDFLIMRYNMMIRMSNR
jgi:Protein of unknown function (DUF3829)